MSDDDRSRWDERYRNGDWADTDEPGTILKQAEAWLSTPGLALDVACGAGRNSLYLARRGFTVISIDISPSVSEGAKSVARTDIVIRISTFIR